jgi:spermidine synthase
VLLVYKKYYTKILEQLLLIVGDLIMAEKNASSSFYKNGSFPVARGFEAEGWYYEEDMAATRLGIRYFEKLHEEQSAFQKICVYDTGFFGKLLTLDDIIMLTERDEFVYHEMLTHLPLCSIPDPKHVLIIGGGDCGCLREVIRHQSIEEAVQCDIDERVTRVSEKWFDWVSPTMADSKAKLIFEDGIAYIKEHKNSFDLIIIDSTDPVGPGVGLFVRDFYRQVAQALKPGGVMVAQTESPMWDSHLVGTIYAEMRATFEHVSPYLGYMPTYPSGMWSWAYASNDRKHDDYFNGDLLAQIEAKCKYYNGDVHKACFMLPNFVRQVVAGDNVFEDFRLEHLKRL